MDYNQAVKEKMVRQKEDSFHVAQPVDITLPLLHKFEQSFYIQDNYENRKFLGFNYKKLVGKNVIPVGLCAVCNKLEVEHND